jgi:putative acetyltransferase
MQQRDARSFLEVHRRSVRGSPTRDYARRIIEAWAPLPISEAEVEAVASNAEGELRLVAEDAGGIVGIAALSLPSAELTACYVSPEASGKGVGTALLAALETRAVAAGLTALETRSSLTAEPFYGARGWQVVERGEHVLSPGIAMAAVTMRKELGPGGV